MGLGVQGLGFWGFSGFPNMRHIRKPAKIRVLETPPLPAPTNLDVGGTQDALIRVVEGLGFRV